MKSQNRPKNRGRDTRFPKGVSRNPGGRPKGGETCADYLTAHLSKDDWAKRIAGSAKKGSIHALTLYASYVFGKPREAFDIHMEEPTGWDRPEMRFIAFLRDKPELLRQYLEYSGKAGQEDE